MTATLSSSRPTQRITSHPYRRAPERVHTRTHAMPVRDQPNYAVRRLIAATVAVVLLALVMVVGASIVPAFADVGGRPAAASDIGTSALDARTHVAQPGDTLWSIADRYRGGIGRDRFVDALIGLNGGTVIQIGQPVRLP